MVIDLGSLGLHSLVLVIDPNSFLYLCGLSVYAVQNCESRKDFTFSREAREGEETRDMKGQVAYVLKNAVWKTFDFEAVLALQQIMEQIA